MTVKRLAIGCLLAGVLVSPSAASATPAACRHLLVDPRGDVNTVSAPSAVVPTSEVDVVFADLRTTRTEVISTIGLVDLPSESNEALDYGYSVDFDTNGERYLLEFVGGKPYDDAYAWHVIGGSENPEQDQGAGAQAAEGVGPNLKFTVDTQRNTVTLHFARSIFDSFGGIGRSLTKVSASTWWGNSVKPTPESGFAGSYTSADFGYSRATYGDLGRSCA
jgi:hypothetical protein